MSEQLRAVFSHEFKQDIWEVLPYGNKLLITLRDRENLQVTFSLFDLEKLTFQWQSISFDEAWWISVYDFQDDVIVFQTYDDTQNIEARSVFGFDINSLEALWSIEDVRLNKAANGLLSVSSLETEDDGFLIDLKTGEEVSKDGHGEPKNDKEVNCKFPIHYETDSPHFETISRFVKSKLEIEIYGSCDYLEMPNFFALALNTKTETGYNLDFFVFNHDGAVLLNKTLDRDLKGLASGTFFIVGQALIFVEGKRNLVFYSF
ncbi:DUF4905 domain-containing protein [Roseivirga sp.]|uniref:DUF4905 domain-containing protein n=1 Tax=Roseivirga sp. TaxID=1964215 RepID=UPI003B8B7A3D